MKLKVFLFKFLFLMFFLLFFKNFSFGFISDNRNYSDFNFNKKNIKNFMFLKKNECFSFVKYQKDFLKKVEIIISNNDYIGFFKENRFRIFYIVKSKDTLYSIAKNSGYNYYELSKFNAIQKPYKIIVGQKIWMGDFFIDLNKNNFSILNLENNTIKKNNAYTFIFQTPLSIKKFLKNNIKSIKICFFCSGKSKKNNDFFRKKSFNFSNTWYWPVKNRNIKYFYDDISGNKNLEIFGFKGQPVFAAAAGEVVCVTDLFEKYGRLIIIRHNKNYLSIYAFNNSILVKEKDKVHEKQQIATMGLSSDTHRVRLYFEIRYLGESVNPLDFLPKINVNV